METLALILSIIALILAWLAYARTGGLKDVRRQLDNLSSKAEDARDRAADALNKIETAVRGSDKARENEAAGKTHEPGKTE